jgi:hypothetical protein
MVIFKQYVVVFVRIYAIPFIHGFSVPKVIIDMQSEGNSSGPVQMKGEIK